MLPNKHYMFDRNCSGLTKRSILNCVSALHFLVFGFTAHSGTAGAQTPVQQPAASRATRIHVQRDTAERELKAQRLELVATYDLTVDPCRFCVEQICARAPANYGKDYKQMCAEDAVRLRKADAFNIVGFQTVKKTAHGGFSHQFDKLLGSMGVAAVGADPMKCVCYKVEEKPHREAHHRNVLGPQAVVVSAMHRSGLLGQRTMKHVQALWDLMRVGVELGGYIFFNSVLVCADVDIKMLRVRAACCTVACCGGCERASKQQ